MKKNMKLSQNTTKNGKISRTVTLFLKAKRNSPGLTTVIMVFPINIGVFSGWYLIRGLNPIIKFAAPTQSFFINLAFK